MPLLRLAVLVSLVGNGVLGAVLLLRQSPPVSEPAPASALTASAELSAPPEPVAPPPVKLETAQIGPFLTDSALSDTDLIARLRAAGTPMDVIRLVVQMRIHARYTDRWNALIAEARNRPYWESSMGIPKSLRRGIQALSREELNERIALLGDDAFAPNEWGNPEQSGLDFLAPAKRTQVSQVLNDFNDLQQDLMMNAMGIFTNEDREILAYLQKERESELSALLSPEELAEFQTRSGPAATDLQQRIQHFEASEPEYLRLMELFASSGISSGDGLPGYTLSREEQMAAGKAWTDLVAQFTAELPPERAELWSLTMDPAYSSIDRFVQQQKLDSSVALGLTRLNRDLNTQRSALLQKGSMTEAQRTVEVTQLLTRTDQDLERLLPTAEARAEFMRSPQGRMIEILKRQLARP